MSFLDFGAGLAFAPATGTIFLNLNLLASGNAGSRTVDFIAFMDFIATR